MKDMLLINEAHMVLLYLTGQIAEFITLTRIIYLAENAPKYMHIGRLLKW